MLLALALSAVLILLAGVNPITAYLALLDGAFGNLYSLGVTLTKTTPLILTGLSVAFAFRCNLLNIGAEGQLYAGALAAVLVGIYVRGLPSFLHIPLCLLSGFLAGAFWGGVAGYLRASRGINEIITTIMLNFVAIYLRELSGPGSPLRSRPGFTIRRLKSSPRPGFPFSRRARTFRSRSSWRWRAP